MATKTRISEAEYLQMTFDGPEPDFVDGELVERGMPNFQHGEVQLVFGGLIQPWRSNGRLFASADLRIRTEPGHHRVVDIVVYRDRRPTQPVPAETPFVAVEIVSPDDKYSELMAKLTEYKTMGIPHVWVIDPAFRSLSIFDGLSLLHVDAFDLPEFQLRFTAAELFGPA